MNLNSLLYHCSLMIKKYLRYRFSIGFAVIICFVFVSVNPANADYTMPKGIPDPAASFGGALDPTDSPTPAWPASWTAGSTSATAGYYYVDKTDPNATDSGNPYGHPDLPRKSIPEGSLNAGDYVYVHAGSYTNIDSGGDRFNWYGTGTSANPIWITGNPTVKPMLQDLTQIGYGSGSTSYLVFENFELNCVGDGKGKLAVRPSVDGDTVDHVVVRNCVLTGTQDAADSSGLSAGWSQSVDSWPNSKITYTVFYNNTISNYGDKAISDEAGIIAGFHVDYLWVLNNTIHDVGSDSIAGSHYSDNNTKKTEHYYIGGNTLYGNGENGIDLKGAKHVIISENTISGPFTREQGWGIVLHYGASPSTTVKDAWVIFNKIHHVSGGIYTSGSVGCDDLHVIGNLIYDVDADYAETSDPLNGYCVFIGGGDGAFHVVDNTFYDYDSGILVQDLDGTDSLDIHGNIFAARSERGGYELKEETDESKINLDYNQFYLSGGSAAFYWGGESRNLNYMQGIASECTNGAEGDPLLFSPVSDFRISSNSPCRDANVKHNVYDTFYNAYGINIRTDKSGISRPQGSACDIGAYEYDEGGVAVPNAPLNLEINTGTVVLK